MAAVSSGGRQSHSYAETPSVGSCSSGGMRQTDSSQSAAAISAAEQTTPITAVRVSPPAACSRPTAGADVREDAGPDAQEDGAHVRAGLREDGDPGDQHRLHRPHGSGARRLGHGPLPGAGVAQGRQARRQRARTERLGDGEHAQRGRQPPVQRRQLAVEAADQPPRREGEAESEDGEVAPADGHQWRWSQRVTASRSSGAARPSDRRPGRARAGRRPGSRVAHGTSTNARSWARGCGRVSSGSSESTGVPSSPVTVTTSTSSVRAPQRTSRVRPAACSSSCARASHPRASRGAADDRDRVQVRRLLDRAPRRGLVEGGARDQTVVLQGGQRGAERAGAVPQVGAERENRSAHARSRRIVTVTSSKGTPRSASGLCTVISTASTSS